MNIKRLNCSMIGFAITLSLTSPLTAADSAADTYAELIAAERLTALGEQKIYRGEYLEAVRLPVGGIGAGTIQINGKAEREIWQIFNNYLDVTIPNSFFAVRAQAPGHEPVVRTLQKSSVGPFEGMADLSFRGEYPFAWYDFEDAALPVTLSMEAFNPLIPLNAKDSAIPCAIFNLTAENTGANDVAVSFLACQQNAVGYTNESKITGRKSTCYGGNRNSVVKRKGATALEMTTEKDPTSAGFGTMSLAAVGDAATGAASIPSLEALLTDFFERPICVEQFQGRWLTLSDAETSCFPTAAEPDGRFCRLGVDAVSGNRVWDVQSSFRIKIGPLGYDQFVRFMPDGDELIKLAHLTRLYVGPGMSFDVQLTLRREEVPFLNVGGDTPARLGWNTWVKHEAFDRDPDDAVYILDNL